MFEWNWQPGYTILYMQRVQFEVVNQYCTLLFPWKHLI